EDDDHDRGQRHRSEIPAPGIRAIPAGPSAPAHHGQHADQEANAGEPGSEAHAEELVVDEVVEIRWQIAGQDRAAAKPEVLGQRRKEEDLPVEEAEIERLDIPL